MTSTRTLALFWTVLLLVLHSIPRDQLERMPGADPLMNVWGYDKFIHIAMFLILGLLWIRRFPQRPLIVLAVGVAYGLALEVYQGWLIQGRSCSPTDALCDAIGLVLATAVATRFHFVSGSAPVRSDLT